MTPIDAFLKCGKNSKTFCHRILRSSFLRNQSALALLNFRTKSKGPTLSAFFYPIIFSLFKVASYTNQANGALN